MRKRTKIKVSLYGNYNKELMSTLPGDMGKEVAQFFTKVYFGDFYTRKSLDPAIRKLISYCVLVSLGVKDQLVYHYYVNLKMGNN